jgi:hypothetical protein
MNNNLSIPAFFEFVMGITAGMIKKSAGTRGAFGHVSAEII